MIPDGPDDPNSIIDSYTSCPGPYFVSPSSGVRVGWWLFLALLSEMLCVEHHVLNGHSVAWAKSSILIYMRQFGDSLLHLMYIP